MIAAAHPTARAATAAMSATEAAALPPRPRASSSQAPSPRAYVQVGALDSQQGATSEWERLQAKMPDLMGGRAPIVQQAEVNGRMFWRLRTGGFTALADANEFCGRVQAAGSRCWAVVAAPPA